MWSNADEMLGRAGEKPIRVASKSIRCRALQEPILRRPGFAGTMTFTLPETLWLAERGFEDLLLAYPTTDGGALEELALRSAAHPEQAPIVMVDSRRAPRPDRVGARRRRGAGPGLHRPRRELVGARAGRVKVGAKRSPVHTPEQAVALARDDRPAPADRPGRA